MIGRFWFACRATVMCLVAPSRFVAWARTYDAGIPRIEPSDDPDAGRRKSARVVSRAFWFSCLLTGGAVVVGYGAGQILRCSTGPVGASTAKLVQELSVAVVLVATLAARGWDIQTYGGISLIEKVNQWLTRSLFVFGTSFFSLFVGWAS